MTRIEQIREMLKEDPADAFLNYALALEEAKSGNISQAARILESIIEKDEDYLAAYYQLGKYYEALSDNEKAISLYRRGKHIAEKQKNRKTLGELNEALLHLDADE